jgi:GntR family transcriptional regulator/MocR family aminotransferase
LRQFRGVAAQSEQVIVVEGAQAALHLAALVLTSRGDGVAIEDPCYALARAAFELNALRLHPVPVDSFGIDPAGLPRKARLAFVTPTHQFPLGGTLPVARRLALLAWAESADAYILEDDYDSEFTAKARPVAALQSLDRAERVLYVGSFSKTLAPAIRLGYLIVPRHLASAFRAARASSSLGASLHLQAAIADFIERGHFARHIRRSDRRPEFRRHAPRDDVGWATARGTFAAVREAAGLPWLPFGVCQRERLGDRIRGDPAGRAARAAGLNRPRRPATRVTRT